MNENYRNTLWRAALITAVVGGATALVGWLMRARFDATVSPIKELRPSAWTMLGVGAMLIPLGLAAYIGLVHWFNRTAPAGDRNDPAVRASIRLRTALLSFAGLVMIAGGVLVTMGEPLKNGHNKSIFLRGFGSGWVLFAALLIVEAVVYELARRSSDRVRRLEALLDDWHTRAGWEGHLPA